ncbi:hypothetical protein R9X47_12295 [Wukongibacter baidiensis]|uniref:hypothetical protein n=1 Tax=Wukongibacter baidiensis TaxID=1723361 RepID=UPI003D7F9500
MELQIEEKRSKCFNSEDNLFLKLHMRSTRVIITPVFIEVSISILRKSEVK